jgi:hypothetical protein
MEEAEYLVALAFLSPSFIEFDIAVNTQLEN